MAECRGFETTPNASGGDVADGMLVQSGEVKYKGKSHKLHLMHKGLRLVAATSEEHGQAGAAAASNNVPVIDLTWRDVLCACEVPGKKSKASSGAGCVGDSHSSAFVIHYIHRNAKHNKLRCRNVTLETESTQRTNEGWISQIEEKCKEGKPQKLLIVINPIGGKGTARQVFEKRIRSIFHLAGVELIVKVTERAKHAVDIAKTFDVSSVDGVLAMGGDGMYMEILHGLTLRKQEEEGVLVNDPDAKLVSPSVPVGIIPAGTGNGVSDWFNGAIDLETATLNIIRGETKHANIFSIHEPGRLIHYAGLLVANGFFSAMIKRTDELRWMKRGRYPYAMMSSLFGKKKLIGLNVEVLKSGDEPNEKKNSEEVEGAEASAAGWTSLGTKQVTAMISLLAKIEEDPDGLCMNPFYPGFDLILLDKASTVDNLKFMLGFFTRKRNTLEKEHIELIANIRGMRIAMADEAGSGASGSQQAELLDLCKLLDVDGEIMDLSQPSFDVRLHPHFLQVFCAPSIYNRETKSVG